MKSITDLAKEERNAYMREWRAKNKDKIKETNNRYWEKKAKIRIEKGGSDEK